MLQEMSLLDFVMAEAGLETDITEEITLLKSPEDT